MTATEIVKALGGRNGMARCPAHKDRTPSLSVSDGPDGKILVHCHAGCSQEAVWAALKDRWLVCKSIDRPVISSPRREVSKPVTDQLQVSDRRAEALAFWEASRPAAHTPGAEYLACRGIVIQPPDCIRYHAGKNALVALVQERNGAFSGMQRVYLATDSRGTWHTGKFSLGPVKGGAVRLTPAAESIQITESVEDGLALLQMTGKATWAVPGAGFMQSFEPPPEVRTLSLCPDHDQAGLEAVEKAHKNLATPSRKVRRLLPPPSKDWCDCLEFFEERAAIRQYDGEEDRENAERRSFREVFCDGS